MLPHRRHSACQGLFAPGYGSSGCSSMSCMVFIAVGSNSFLAFTVLVTRQQRFRRYIYRAQATVAMRSTPQSSAASQAIPDDLKQHIWT